MMGAVSQKVGFACVQAEMGSNEAISQLARLRTKVKYTVALRLIEADGGFDLGSRLRLALCFREHRQP
jgi:hypothetical protein